MSAPARLHNVCEPPEKPVVLINCGACLHVAELIQLQVQTTHTLAAIA